MKPQGYQVPEVRDENDNIIQIGTFGKKTEFVNKDNTALLDYIINNLEALKNLLLGAYVWADSVSAMPTTGDATKLYIAKDTGKQYRWNGSSYTELTAQINGLSAYEMAVQHNGYTGTQEQWLAEQVKAVTSAEEATASKQAAATSETNAANSATAAGTSASNAADSAKAANDSANAAGTSAEAAAQSATDAASSATAASQSATAAQTSANDASASATNAATAATAAANSATAVSAVSSISWQSGAARKLGEWIVSPNLPAGCIAQVTTAGTSGTTEPSWGTKAGVTITDGSVTWSILMNYSLFDTGSGFKVYKYYNPTSGKIEPEFHEWGDIQSMTPGVRYNITLPITPTKILVGSPRVWSPSTYVSMSGINTNAITLLINGSTVTGAGYYIQAS